MTKLTLKSTIYFIIYLLIPVISNGQKGIADSITVSFGLVDTLNNAIKIDKVIDFRLGSPSQLSVYEQKKWLFFPVDQIVKTPTSLSNEFRQKYSPKTSKSQNYGVAIHEFYIKNSIEGGKRKLTLFSTIELSKYDGSDSSFLGTYYYEQSYIQKKKIPVVLGYEKLLDIWGNKFVSDVLAVEQELDMILEDNLYHFRRNNPAVKKNLYTEVEFFAGLNYWGIDGDIWFSEPEGNRIFKRSAGIMRYVNHLDFQAIAFGKNLSLWNYRINEKWLFTNKMAFLIGFNNWKDMSTVAHKMEEIPLFNLSFTQRINYNHFDNSGWVFGVGIMEDLHYIIYHKPKLNVGLTMNCTYKF